LIEEAVKLSTEPLVVNQVEMHPYLDQSRVIAASRKHGLAVTAYSPIARGNSSGDKALARIGAQHGKSAAQVSLRYLVQQDVIVIPRTSKAERLKENLAIFDFTLSEKEVAEIKGLSRQDGRVVDPGVAPDWD
jgi:diketogulonate reductase-like aldo/keto reductase